MNAKHIFIDSNIIIYSYDYDAAEKHCVAKEKLQGLWYQERPPSISIQVLQECYVNFLRKKISSENAQKILHLYSKWNVINNDYMLLMVGIALQNRWKISFWDALILAAAKKSGADIIWSEDFNASQDYDGIRVVNPFSSKG